MTEWDKSVNVLSLPRSGTNLLAAIFNSHPEFYAINAGGRRFREPKQCENIGDCSIYPQSKIYFDSVPRIIWMDEVNISFSSILFLLKQKLYGKKPTLVSNVRNPFGVLGSMNNFSKKWNRPGWRLTEKTVSFVIDEILSNWRLVRLLNMYPIYFDLFIKDIGRESALILSRLGVSIANFDESVIKETAINQGCECGGRYRESMSDAIYGNFFESRGLKKESPECVLRCDSCSKELLGYWGFNTFYDIDFERICLWRKSLNEEEIQMISKEIVTKMGRDALCFFLDEGLSNNTRDDYHYLVGI